MAGAYRARVNEREFLSLPGFRSSPAVVIAYVEDTSERELPLPHGRRAYNIEPQVILELRDCSRSVAYELQVDSPDACEESMYMLDMIRAMVEHVADALLEEAFLFQERQKVVDPHNADLPDAEAPF